MADSITQRLLPAVENGVLEVVLPASGIETARTVPIEIQEPGKKTIKAA